ncbi:MAG: Rrf2 family transcriptional regulator [Acidobacteriota bacterium]
MQLTRAADFGVRAMVHLASLEPGTRVPLGALSAAADVSPAFLSKVLQRLVRAGYVSSRRGRTGGFALVPREISLTLLDIISALDGLPPLNDCLKTEDACLRRTWCGVYPVWQQAQAQLRALMAAASLDSLVRDTAARRAALGLGPL